MVQLRSSEVVKFLHSVELTIANLPALLAGGGVAAIVVRLNGARELPLDPALILNICI